MVSTMLRLTRESKAPLGVANDVLPDPVENDDGVVHAVPGDGEDPDDEGRVDLQVNQPAQDGEDAEDYQGVVGQRDDGTDP